MAWLLRCPNQHHCSIPHPPATNDTLAACPICGANATIVPDQEGGRQASSEDTLCGPPSGAALSSVPMASVAASESVDQTMDESFHGQPTNSVTVNAQPEKPAPTEVLDQTLAPVSVAERLDQGDTEHQTIATESLGELEQTLAPPSSVIPPSLSPGAQAFSHEGGETLITEQIGLAAPTGPLPNLHGEIAHPTVGVPQLHPTHDAYKTAPADGHAPGSQGNRPKGAAPASPLDGYELLGVLGRGGMGIVYKARQTKLDRLVALKMVLSETYASAQERKLFIAEAQAVAKLIHANIVQIYEVGEGKTGQPYFSLEYLAGGTLQEKLEKYVMPPRDAALMIEVLARGVSYAHQKGVLHRDIKPANVLLTSDGVPKISDFGLAKRLDQSESLNADNAIVGTPMYMPPEQTLGNSGIGPAADIYSLGATLYEMIAGRPPFRGTTVLDTLQMVQNTEPVAPRHLQPSVPADLQTICLKCLQKDPKQRYQTAADFANDLRNFLDGKPIAARPVPAWEKAWKWSRRNPAAALLIAVSCVSLLLFAIGGVTFAIAENHRARVESNLRQTADEQRLLAVNNGKLAEENFLKAEEQRKLALKRRAEAQEHFQRAHRAVDVMVRLAQKRMMNERHLESVGKELLESALQFYEELLKHQPTDPAMQAQIARAQLFAGDVYEKLGRYDEADKAYSEAERRYRTLMRDLPKTADDYQQKLSSYRRDLAGIYINWSTVLQVLNKDADADSAFAKATRLLEQVLANNSRDPLTEWLMGRGSARRGMHLHQQMQVIQAEEAYQQAITLFSRLARENEDEPGYKVELANAKNSLAYLWTELPAKQADAAPLYQEALDLLKPLLKNTEVPAFKKEEGLVHLHRGILFTKIQRYAEAHDDLARAGEIFDKLAQDNRGITDYLDLRARQQLILSGLLRQEKDWPAAEQAARLAVSRYEKLAADKLATTEYKRNWVRTLKNLAAILDEQLRTTVMVNPLLGASTVGLIGPPAGRGPFLAAAAIYPGRTDKTSAREWSLLANKTERAWNEAVERPTEMNKQHPGDILFAAELTEIYQGLIGFHNYAAAILRVSSFAQAEAHLGHTVRFCKEFLALQPENEAIQTQAARSMCAVALLRVVRGKHAEAAHMIEEMSQIVNPKLREYRLGVVILLRCMDSAEKSHNNNAVKAYGDRAMTMLEATVNAKEDYRATLESPDLLPLRLRPEFRARYEKLQNSH